MVDIVGGKFITILLDQACITTGICWLLTYVLRLSPTKSLFIHNLRNHFAPFSGASSPGEFFDHALEFINGSEKDSRPQWASSDLRRGRIRHEETDMPRSKRVKTSSTYDVDFPMYQSQRKSNSRPKSPYHKNDSDRSHPYGRYDIKAKHFYNPLRRDHHTSPLHSLSPDQKFFVDAFKKEVTSAAVRVAEASALRVLEILDEHGICFSHFGEKSQLQSRSLPDNTSKYPTRSRLDPTHTTSPEL